MTDETPHIIDIELTKAISQRRVLIDGHDITNIVRDVTVSCSARGNPECRLTLAPHAVGVKISDGASLDVFITDEVEP